MSSSSFLQTKHHSSFNMQQMIREEVEGMARPKRFFSSSCKTGLSTPSELTVGNPTCNKCSTLVLDINFCGLWGKSIELKQFLFQALWSEGHFPSWVWFQKWVLWHRCFLPSWNRQPFRFTQETGYPFRPFGSFEPFLNLLIVFSLCLICYYSFKNTPPLH